jgi:hypothetical protein
MFKLLPIVFLLLVWPLLMPTFRWNHPAIVRCDRQNSCNEGGYEDGSIRRCLPPIGTRSPINSRENTRGVMKI